MRILLTTIAAAALLTGSALAQTEAQSGAGAAQDNNAATQGGAAGNAGASSGNMSADDQEIRNRATQNAERVGMSDVRILDRVFVVQGTTPQGETVFMIVNPPGALIGLGTPTNAGSGASGGSGQSGDAAASGNAGAGAASGSGGEAGGNASGQTGGAAGTDASGSGQTKSN